MELIIKLKREVAILELDGVDSKTFTYYHDLDEKLITGIDKLLKKNKIDISSVKSYKIESNLDENSTSTKIVQAAIEALKS
jgi:hypothetical protein